MNPAIIISISFFACIFGIFFLFFQTRNKERLALIEHDKDASIFKFRKDRSSPVWAVILLNLSLVLMGVGFGFLIGNLIEAYTVLNDDLGYIASLFFTPGAFLLLGFYLTRKLKL
ncbi:MULTISPECIES: DUF6249 domain-containing protein [Zunongwangia]|jgi:hypothetical protein|uniref:DUF6249 domain-containing protein n=1 Tax=Zunongwangia TaxID=417127 RepID=UPI000C9639D0|nr:DUF6249 domain-containing protein [Zunongwangia profunda]MAG88622.1 hypothetical protein [Flavobacteriaceae bacterium]MCC4230907.1 hypothetical protein [Zunongwangia profunda]|tara:strand:+ start:219 stop:563 length:345 start_codon:yes stop_codon:yes gene_type:complete